VTRPGDASPELVRELETLAARAWPAREIEPCDGWRLRWGEEGTWRTRSVWPNADERALGASEKIARAETFYARRGEPARFQIAPSSRPADLDARLAERGYGIDRAKSAHVLVGTLDGLRAGAGGLRVDLAASASPEWIEAYRACVGIAPATLGARAALFARIAPPRLHACVRDADGGAAAVCLGVVDEGWLGLYALATRPERRRRGAARAALAALADAAHDLGAARAYLQVERGNAAALTLYARAGFARHHGYHYRVSRGGP
jgi:GNAT superfamily N-acetyltransferase